MNLSSILKHPRKSQGSSSCAGVSCHPAAAAHFFSFRVFSSLKLLSSTSLPSILPLSDPPSFRWGWGGRRGVPVWFSSIRLGILWRWFIITFLKAFSPPHFQLFFKKIKILKESHVGFRENRKRIRKNPKNIISRYEKRITTCSNVQSFPATCLCNNISPISSPSAPSPPTSP